MKLDIAEAAALHAADEWVSAQEALVAAQQVSQETEAEQEAVDLAGSRLAVAVTRWRARRPPRSCDVMYPEAGNMSSDP
jgi:hypothetical protein